MLLASVSRAAKVRLGVFVAAGLTVLVGGIAALAGMKLGEERDTYVVRFSDSDVSLSGLEVGSQVKYSGIRVGRVGTIRVDPEDVSVIVVTLDLAGGTPVAEDTKASLGAVGITGLKYVELTRGSKSARIRAPGEEIPAGSSLIDDLTSRAEEIAGQVRIALDHVTAFTAPDMKDRVARVLDRTERLLTTLEAAVNDNRAELSTLLTRLAATARQVEALSGELTGTARRTNLLLDEVRPRTVQVLDETLALVTEMRATREEVGGDVQATLAETVLVLREARATLGEEGLGRTLAELSRLLKRSELLLLQNREGVTEAVGYLKETGENLAEFSAKVREDPSLLLLGEREGEDPR